MGCGCNKGVKAYVYVAEDGTRTERSTEVEAKAIMVRAGNVGKVEPVPVE